MCVSPPMAGSGEIIADAQNEKVRTFSGCVVCARWPVIWIDQSYSPMRMMASARGGCEAAARARPLKLGGYKKGRPVSSRPNSPRTRPTTHHRLPTTPELPFELSSHPRYSVSGFGLSRRPFPSPRVGPRSPCAPSGGGDLHRYTYEHVSLTRRPWTQSPRRDIISKGHGSTRLSVLLHISFGCTQPAAANIFCARKRTSAFSRRNMHAVDYWLKQSPTEGLLLM